MLNRFLLAFYGANRGRFDTILLHRPGLLGKSCHMFDGDNAMPESFRYRIDNANLRGVTTIFGVRPIRATQGIYGIFRALSFNCKINFLLGLRVTYLARFPAGIVPPGRLTASVANWVIFFPTLAPGY